MEEEIGGKGIHIPRVNDHTLEIAGAGGYGSGGERFDFSLKKGETFTVQFDAGNGKSI